MFADTANETIFRWLNTFNLGRFDTPGIFAFKDLKRGVFYRNYEIYNGYNFNTLSEEFLTAIKRQQK